MNKKQWLALGISFFIIATWFFYQATKLNPLCSYTSLNSVCIQSVVYSVLAELFIALMFVSFICEWLESKQKH